jgi:hypothetical protein
MRGRKWRAKDWPVKPSALTRANEQTVGFSGSMFRRTGFSWRRKLAAEIAYNGPTEVVKFEIGSKLARNWWLPS